MKDTPAWVGLPEPLPPAIPAASLLLLYVHSPPFLPPLMPGLVTQGGAAPRPRARKSRLRVRPAEVKL